jgi:hypothetical protein
VSWHSFFLSSVFLHEKEKNQTEERGMLTWNTSFYMLNFHRCQIGLNKQLLDV